MIWLNPEHGQWITSLAEVFDIIWVTGWEHDAPRLLGPLLELPSFSVLEFSERPSFGSRLAKLPDVAAFVEQRSVAWIDDDFDEAAVSWAEKRPWPTVLVQPATSRGLEARHIQELLRFAEDHGSTSALRHHCCIRKSSPNDGGCPACTDLQDERDRCNP